MISFKSKGDFKTTERYLKKSMGRSYQTLLDRYGQMGVDELARYTPKDTGLTANSWKYELRETTDGVSIIWNNTNVVKGVNIAVILQYGHGTRNGGYVVGTDYINPALKPIFEELAEKAWKEVKSLE